MDCVGSSLVLPRDERHHYHRRLGRLLLVFSSFPVHGPYHRSSLLYEFSCGLSTELSVCLSVKLWQWVHVGSWVGNISVDLICRSANFRNNCLSVLLWRQAHVGSWDGIIGDVM